MATGKTLVSHDYGVFEHRPRESGMSTHVNLVWRKPRRRAERIVLSELDERELQISVVMSFIDDDSQHLSNYVVRTLHAPLTG